MKSNMKVAEKRVPLRATRASAFLGDEPAMTPASAVETIRKLRKGQTLGALRLRDLIRSGRR